MVAFNTCNELFGRLSSCNCIDHFSEVSTQYLLLYYRYPLNHKLYLTIHVILN